MSQPPSDAVSFDILLSPPFVVVPGVINIRALGGTSADGSQKHIKPFHIFRSGELTRITDIGRSKLHELGVTTVFDLRSDSEIAQFQSATPDISGIRFVRTPALTEDAWKADIAKIRTRSNGALCGAFLYGTVNYFRVADIPSFYVQLMGVSDNDIAHDYSLSTAGLAPSVTILESRFRSIPVFRDNWEGFSKMSSAKAETMIAVLLMIRQKFGGVEGYLKTHAGLTDEDLATIRANMLISN
ncbi:hypothetical protein C0995_008266 [Termitomyces sp. Mi166|nr:hypothetical protein C0995_008266 [Termitomyces sp. Mi166\